MLCLFHWPIVEYVAKEEHKLFTIAVYLSLGIFNEPSSIMCFLSV